MKYKPWTDGYAVGFECQVDGKTVNYVYLNPSSEDSEGEANVFIYIGPHGDPALDSPVIYVNTDQESK